MDFDSISSMNRCLQWQTVTVFGLLVTLVKAAGTMMTGQAGGSSGTPYGLDPSIIADPFHSPVPDGGSQYYPAATQHGPASYPSSYSLSAYPYHDQNQYPVQQPPVTGYYGHLSPSGYYNHHQYGSAHGPQTWWPHQTTPQPPPPTTTAPAKVKEVEAEDAVPLAGGAGGSWGGTYADPPASRPGYFPGQFAQPANPFSTIFKPSPVLNAAVQSGQLHVLPTLTGSSGLLELLAKRQQQHAGHTNSNYYRQSGHSYNPYRRQQPNNLYSSPLMWGLALEGLF